MASCEVYVQGSYHPTSVTHGIMWSACTMIVSSHLCDTWHHVERMYKDRIIHSLRQMASWEEDSSHSLFTKYFLKAMSGEGDSNKDGKVSDSELKEYLSDTMTYYARRYYGRDEKVQIHNGG